MKLALPLLIFALCFWSAAGTAVDTQEPATDLLVAANNGHMVKNSIKPVIENIPDDCSLDCMNGGKCVFEKDPSALLGVKSGWSMRCLCIPGYKGYLCHESSVNTFPQDDDDDNSNTNNNQFPPSNADSENFLNDDWDTQTDDQDLALDDNVDDSAKQDDDDIYEWQSPQEIQTGEGNDDGHTAADDDDTYQWQAPFEFQSEQGSSMTTDDDYIDNDDDNNDDDEFADFITAYTYGFAEDDDDFADFVDSYTNGSPGEEDDDDFSAPLKPGTSEKDDDDDDGDESLDLEDDDDDDDFAASLVGTDDDELVSKGNAVWKLAVSLPTLLCVLIMAYYYAKVWRRKNTRTPAEGAVWVAATNGSEYSDYTDQPIIPNRVTGSHFSHFEASDSLSLPHRLSGAFPESPTRPATSRASLQPEYVLGGPEYCDDGDMKAIEMC